MLSQVVDQEKLLFVLDNMFRKIKNFANFSLLFIVINVTSEAIFTLFMKSICRKWEKYFNECIEQLFFKKGFWNQTGNKYSIRTQ